MKTSVRIRRCVTAVVLLSLVVFLSRPVAATQAGGSVQLGNGQTVTWSEDWTPGPAGLVSDRMMEALVLIGRSGDTVGYLTAPAGISSAEMVDVLISSLASEGVLETVDAGAYEDVAYNLSRQTFEDETIGMFIVVVSDASGVSASVIRAMEHRFDRILSAAQVGVSIDGVPIFDGVDGGALQRQLDAHVPSATPEGETEAPSPHVTALQPAGVEVRYSDDWQVVGTAPDAIELNTPGLPSAFIGIMTGDPGGMGGSAEIVSTMVELASGAQVLDAVDAPNGDVVVLLGDNGANGPIYILYEEIYLPDSSVSVMLAASPDDLPDALAYAQATVMVNGAPAMEGVENLFPALGNTAD